MADTADPRATVDAPLALRDLFPPIPTDAWDGLARADLKGADYDARLVWRTDEGVTVRPFHRREDLAGLEAQTGAVPGAPPFVRGDLTPWRVVETPDWPADAIRADRLHDAGATAVQELAWAVADGVDRIAIETDGGRSVDDAARGLAFVFAVGSLYFVEIAKLRAARLLWGAAVAAFGPTRAASGAMRLHVRTARANKSVYDPYTNLLRLTTEAMAAAIGGADSVLVEPHGFDPHLAVNVQRILVEEAHLDAVADPAGGSYYVETLTDGLGREAWALFQEIEAAGGAATARKAGLLAAQLEASRSRRTQAVALRRRTLVGVNNYPDLTEKAPVAGPFPEADSGDPPPMRLAAPFEAIRARTARHAAATGRTPVIHLFTRGDLRMRMARANFCLNFFGCAGFDVTQGDVLPPSPDLVVLCSADDAYLALAREVVPAASVPVIVAGYPREGIDDLRTAGVQGFVHVRSDAVATLTEWQDRLGMRP